MLWSALYVYRRETTKKGGNKTYNALHNLIFVTIERNSDFVWELVNALFFQINMFKFFHFLCYFWPKNGQNRLFPIPKRSKCEPHSLCQPIVGHGASADLQHSIFWKKTIFRTCEPLFWRLMANVMPKIRSRKAMFVFWAEKRPFFVTPLNAHSNTPKIHCQRAMFAFWAKK